MHEVKMPEDLIQRSQIGAILAVPLAPQVPLVHLVAMTQRDLL